MDSLTSERRSWLMSQVRSRDTSPEVRVRQAAHALGLRFRLYRRDLPGTPDLIFPKHRVVVFVHGCFWHRHGGCKKATTPKTNVEFWQGKFDRNVRRDQRLIEEIRAVSWRAEIIWQCETKGDGNLDRRLREMFGLSSQPMETISGAGALD